MLILSAMKPCLLLEMVIVCMISWVRITLSLTFLPSMKLAWYGWMDEAGNEWFESSEERFCYHFV